MNIDRRILLLVPAMLMGGCAHDEAGGSALSTFGEANRQTLAAQVVDPDPQYEFLDPATSADRAAQAVDRHRQGKVKQPERVRSTERGGS